MTESKIGNWTITEAGMARLEALRTIARFERRRLQRMATECCQILGIDPEAESLARDFAEEIVFHGAEPEEAIAKIRDLTPTTFTEEQC